MSKRETENNPSQKARQYKVLLKSFYDGNRGPLLSELMRKGYDAFARTFADMFLAKARSDVIIEPDVVASGFRGHFEYHMEFRDFALTFCEDEFKQINAKNIDQFLQVISGFPRYAEFANRLKEDEIRIICLCLTEKNKSKSDAKDIAKMFPGNGALVTEIEQLQPSAVMTSKRKEFTPERGSALSLLRATLQSIKDSGKNLAPTNAEMREILVTNLPELIDWIKLQPSINWVSKYLSMEAKKLGLTTGLSSRHTKEQNSIAPIEKVKKHYLTEKSPEQLEVLKIIEQLHGLPVEQPVFWKVEGMIEEIKTRLPHLSGWAAESDNRSWVRRTLGNMKFSMTHKSRSKKAKAIPQVNADADAQQVVQQIEQQEQPKTELKIVHTSSSEPDLQTNLIDIMEQFKLDMERGVVLPREVLIRGAEIEAQIEEFEKEIRWFQELKEPIMEFLNKYRQLGIKL